jgi:DNA-directed RNA polymerase specialized sigma subunit
METEGMTRERLEAYRSNNDEIKELQGKLQKMGTEEGKEKLVESDTIIDYRKGYPRPQIVTGYNYSKEQRLRQRYSSRIEKLQKEQEEIEQWIFEIEDSKIQRIFRLRYLEGMRQEKIAQKVHMAQSGVSRRIDEYLKNNNV